MSRDAKRHQSYYSPLIGDFPRVCGVVPKYIPKQKPNAMSKRKNNNPRRKHYD